MAPLVQYSLGLVLSLSTFVFAEPREASSRAKTQLHALSFTSTSSMQRRHLLPRQNSCSGSCSDCFGDSYHECPGSDSVCYSTSDPSHPIDTCPGYGMGNMPTATSSSASASTSTTLCPNGGTTCSQCFGSGYIFCPGSLQHCHDPSDPTSVCPGDSGSGSGISSNGTTSGGGSGGSSCASQYGSGSVTCAVNWCYNPSDGETCCSDGSYCDAGETCSNPPGTCNKGGSSGSGSSSGSDASSGSGSSSSGSGSSGNSGSGSSGTTDSSATTASSFSGGTETARSGGGLPGISGSSSLLEGVFKVTVMALMLTAGGVVIMI